MTDKKLGFGCMRLPLLNPNDPTSVDMPQFERMVDTFIERGFTYFDTAWMYHNFISEEKVREALVKRHARNTYTIATKMPIMMVHSEGKQAETFDKQLEKLGVDYFDYYLVHSLNEANYKNATKLHTFEFLSQKKAEGVIKHLGLSFHDTPELLDRILCEHPEVEFVQIQLNYMDWENESIQSRKCYETATRHNKPVIVMEPIKGGTLNNVPDEVKQLFKEAKPEMSVASWAIRFAASCPNVMMVLSGMSNYEQLLDNTSYMAHFEPLSEADRAVIEKAVKIINQAIKIPCTACNYCAPGCPKRIPIPSYFSLYNAEKLFNTDGLAFTPQQAYYANNVQNGFGKASECIKCKKCEKICPQHIHISDWMAEVASTFEK